MFQGSQEIIGVIKQHNKVLEKIQVTDKHDLPTAVFYGIWNMMKDHALFPINF